MAAVKRYRITRAPRRLDRASLNPAWLEAHPQFAGEMMWEVGYRALNPRTGEPWQSDFLRKYFTSEAAAQKWAREHSDGLGQARRKHHIGPVLRVRRRRR